MKKVTVYVIAMVLFIVVIAVVVKGFSCSNTYEEEIKDDIRMGEGVRDLEEERIGMREKVSNIMSRYMPR